MGAQAVLATLWPIPDDPIKAFIADFFRLWMEEGKTLRSALSLARELHGDDPIVGSAFVLLEAASEPSHRQAERTVTLHLRQRPGVRSVRQRS